MLSPSFRSQARRLGTLLTGTFMASMLVAMLGPSGCLGVSSDRCRLHPEDCQGGAGSLCEADLDCNGGLECCTEDKNCGGGMCTLACDEDLDCPSDMLCEHKVCFYMCSSDEDCADSMSCEHGNTICEYP